MSTQLARETARRRRIWEKGAEGYDKRISFIERMLVGDGRAWVCAQASGEVLEVAVGTGRNLPFYPEGVRLTGIDLSPAMLAIARTRADECGVQIDLREGDAQALPFADASFDTALCTLSLCNIPDDRLALAEMTRVLRPGGRLLLLDHVRSSTAPVRAIQRLLELCSMRSEGDRMLRRPVMHVRALGFQIKRDERTKLGIVERVSAVKPA